MPTDILMMYNHKWNCFSSFICSFQDEFDHPYVSFLFYGMDAAGDFIPIKQLREKYNKPRHELPWEEEKSKDDPKDDSSKKP
jgi:hypothetical protein